MMLSDVCLTSVAYIWPKSRTERPSKTKIGTEVAHVTRDLDTTFKVKRSKIKVTRPLWLAVQVATKFISTPTVIMPPPKVTTCTGWGHSVAAPLQAAQPVCIN